MNLNTISSPLSTVVIVKNKKHSYEEKTPIQKRKGKHQGDFFCGNVMWKMLDCFKKKIQKWRKNWKKCHHFSTATKSLSQLPTLLLLRGNFEQISKNCGEHILNLLWDAHQCPQKKIEEEKKTLAIRGRATHGDPLVWNRCCAVLDFERTLWFQF